MENKNEWKNVKLGEIIDILNGYSFKKEDFSEYGIPVIKIKNIKSLAVDTKDVQFVNKKFYEEKKKYRISYKDILLSMTGSHISQINSVVGRVARMKKVGKYLLNQRVAKLTSKNKKILNEDFLYYFLSQEEVTYQLALSASGSANQANIGNNNIYELIINLPPLLLQEKIAKILSDIDSKIELNNKINDNLEKQIQFLYKSWFVDFIPFNKIVPLDWEEILLSDIAEFINGYSYKGKELSKSNTAMATIKNFSRNGTFNTNGYKEIVISEKVKPEHYLKNFDILVAHTDLTQNADIIGNAEMIFNKLNYQNIIFSMDLVKIIPKSKNISKFLLILLLKNSNFKNHCLSYVNGTTVLHLSKKALQEYKVFLPKNLEILNPLINLISKIYEKLSLLSKENKKLTNLKSYLLPKLMNGEIDVENIKL